MRKYFSNLQDKPDYHKRQFAMLVSGTITLFILGVWSLTSFGVTNSGVVANEDQDVSPFDVVKSNLAASFQAIGENLGLLEDSVKNLDMEAGYKDLRENALDTYGR